MGAPLLVVENAASDPVGRLGDWLTEAGLEVQVVRPHRGDPLPERVEGGGVVLLGGPMGAHDDERAPWLPVERELIRTLVRDEIPTLGHLSRAPVAGRRHRRVVRKRPDGPELGALLVAKRTASATDPLFQELPITPDVVQWHFDEVVALPPGRRATGQLARLREPGVPARPAGVGPAVPHRDHARHGSGLGRLLRAAS